MVAGMELLGRTMSGCHGGDTKVLRNRRRGSLMPPETILDRYKKTCLSGRLVMLDAAVAKPRLSRFRPRLPTCSNVKLDHRQVVAASIGWFMPACES
jgi:hypothetical protein